MIRFDGAKCGGQPNPFERGFILSMHVGDLVGAAAACACACISLSLVFHCRERKVLSL